MGALFVSAMQSKAAALDCLTLKYGAGSSSRNVGNYLSTLRNIPEERRAEALFVTE